MLLVIYLFKRYNICVIYVFRRKGMNYISAYLNLKELIIIIIILLDESSLYLMLSLKKRGKFKCLN